MIVGGGRVGCAMGRINQRRITDERSQLVPTQKQTIHLARNVQRKEVKVLE